MENCHPFPFPAWTPGYLAAPSATLATRASLRPSGRAPGDLATKTGSCRFTTGRWPWHWIWKNWDHSCSKNGHVNFVCLCICLFLTVSLCIKKCFGRLECLGMSAFCLQNFTWLLFQSLILATLSNSSHFFESNTNQLEAQLNPPSFFRMVKPEDGQTRLVPHKTTLMASHRKAALAAKAARSYAEEALKQSLQADTEEAGSVPWMGWSCCFLYGFFVIWILWIN